MTYACYLIAGASVICPVAYAFNYVPVAAGPGVIAIGIVGVFMWLAAVDSVRGKAT